MLRCDKQAVPVDEPRLNHNTAVLTPPQTMPISESELLGVLRAIRNQQDVQGSSWVRLWKVARGTYGPDDEDRLRLCAQNLRMEDYLDIQEKVRLTREGERAAESGEFERDDTDSNPESFDPNDPFSKGWFAKDGIVPVDAAVISGNAPFRRGALEAYLEGQLGVDVGPVDGRMEDPELLILGRQNHEEGVVESFLNEQRGTTLRICSQEMLLSWICTGCDPNRYPGSLSQFIGGHPALERVRDILEDEWPEPGEGMPPVSSRGGGNTFNAEVEKGPLRRSGYHVGETGETIEVRRKALEDLFAESREGFPGTYPFGYLDGWGNPESGVRLEKMANSIATFCRNHRRRENASAQAINDWEADLRWLKNNFYHPLGFGFDWPGAR